jgi:hypothetical protein
LCGVSGPDQLRNDRETVDQHVARVTDETEGRWKAALLESGDPKRRAVGLALVNAKPSPDSWTYTAPDTPSNNDLVLLAMETNDPAIYALALGQCGEDNLDMAVGPCRGLSLEHWAQIDPDNAVPWMWIASRADRAGNHVQADEALGRAANASRLDSYVGAMSALALAALPPEVAPLEKAVAGADLISISRLVAPVALIADRLEYYVFDVLYLEGFDLRLAQLVERKRLLEQVLRDATASRVHLSKHLQFEGTAVFKEACAMHLEGIVCKQEASVYRSGRQDSWIKVKCTKSGTYPIVAFVEKLGANPRRAASLYLFVPNPEQRPSTTACVRTRLPRNLALDIVAGTIYSCGEWP